MLFGKRQIPDGDYPQPIITQINRFSGVNVSKAPMLIDTTESPDLLNVIFDDKGTIDKRPGYKSVIPQNLGTGKINGIFTFKKSDSLIKLFAHTTKLYTWNDGEEPVEIYNNLNDSILRTFVFNDKLYILDGIDYLEYDGTSIKKVTDIAYIPTVTMGRLPTGGGNAFEEINILTPKFKDSFSPDGAATKFVLSLKNLDLVPVVANVNGTEMTEGNGFTVDKTLGEVTFNTAPIKGTDSLVITASKTFYGYADRIKKCKIVMLYGGENDTRVFLSGNNEYKNYRFHSAVFDPTYFPENNFVKIGSDYTAITGFSLHYDTQIIFKEKSKDETAIFYSRYNTYNDRIIFPVYPLNDAVGCTAPNSIQTIENSPMFLSEKGIYTVKSSSVRDERNVSHVSEKIDNLLLDEVSLKDSVSIDYEKKYILKAGNSVYICDYRQIGPDGMPIWYIWDNINASCLTEINSYLYFGSDTEGMIYRFKKKSEIDIYNDCNKPIKAYWKSLLLDLGADYYRKMIDTLFYNLKPDIRSSVDIYYETSNHKSGPVKTSRLDMFNFSLFGFNLIDFSKFSFNTSKYPQPKALKIRARKVSYIQITFKNERLDENMGIASFSIKFTNQGEVR